MTALNNIDQEELYLTVAAAILRNSDLSIVDERIDNILEIIKSKELVHKRVAQIDQGFNWDMVGFYKKQLGKEARVNYYEIANVLRKMRYDLEELASKPYVKAYIKRLQTREDAIKSRRKEQELQKKQIEEKESQLNRLEKHLEEDLSSSKVVLDNNSILAA